MEVELCSMERSSDGRQGMQPAKLGMHETLTVGDERCHRAVPCRVTQRQTASYRGVARHSCTAYSVAVWSSLQVAAGVSGLNGICALPADLSTMMRHGSFACLVSQYSSTFGVYACLSRRQGLLAVLEVVSLPRGTVGSPPRPLERKT